MGSSPMSLSGWSLPKIISPAEALFTRHAKYRYQGDLWVVPVERMKAGRKHTVPLSPAALELVKFNVEGWVWPGKKGPLSDMAMLELLRGMRPGLTVHGFRSSFRDWCAEATDVQNHVAEMCLALAIENAVEAAYRRGELLAKRRDLLEQWAAFVTGV